MFFKIVSNSKNTTYLPTQINHHTNAKWKIVVLVSPVLEMESHMFKTSTKVCFTCYFRVKYWFKLFFLFTVLNKFCCTCCEKRFSCKGNLTRHKAAGHAKPPNNKLLKRVGAEIKYRSLEEKDYIRMFLKIDLILQKIL